MAGTVHVVGAGLAGLSAAVALAERGARVVVHEAAKQAGGRCRSYYDPTLGLTIDNGNHLLLSGNTAALGFLRDHRRAGRRPDRAGRGRVRLRRPQDRRALDACAPTRAGCPGGC